MDSIRNISEVPALSLVPVREQKSHLRKNHVKRVEKDDGLDYNKGRTIAKKEAFARGLLRPDQPFPKKEEVFGCRK